MSVGDQPKLGRAGYQNSLSTLNGRLFLGYSKLSQIDKTHSRGRDNSLQLGVSAKFLDQMADVPLHRVRCDAQPRRH